MVILPVVEGLFGVFVDVPNNTLSIGPCWPDGLKGAALSGIRIGETTAEVRVDTAEGRLELFVTAARPDLKVQLCPLVPEGSRVGEIRLNGQVVDGSEASLKPCGRAQRVCLETRAGAGLHLEVSFDFGQKAK